jgi:hypothetical protein
MHPRGLFSTLLRSMRPILSPSALFAVAVFGLLFFQSPRDAACLDVTLAWDANTEDDLAGYRVFARAEGESFDYQNPDWEGTATTCTLYGLDDDTSYVFVARAFDLSGNESGDSDPAFYSPPQNASPTADAGPDQTVAEGDAVTLDGTNSSDPDGTIVSYAWAQTAGTPVMLSDPASDTPWFTAPIVGASGEALIFELTVMDNGGLSGTDTVIVNVSNVNQAPTADAGPDQAAGEGARVTLDGSNSSDPDGTIAAFNWTQTAGVAVTLTNPHSAQPFFTAPDVGPAGASLRFRLTVTDDGGLQSTDTCIVNVSWVNLPPEADAGVDLTVNEGDQVTLDGSGSIDPDDGIAGYLWTQRAGTSVTLSDPTSDAPWFTAPVVGVGGAALTFELTVTDSGGLSDTDTVIVNVSNVNQAPIADAGPNQAVGEGETVTLDGSGSLDPDGTVASYSWSQTAGVAVTLSNPSSAQPFFTAPDVGPSGASLTFQLTVTDDSGLQSTDTCIVDVSWADDEAPAPPTGLSVAHVD